MVKVSLVMLTMGRKEAVNKSLSSNIDSMGLKYDFHEIIHVDNGSGAEFCDWFQNTFRPDVQIRNETNLGVAKGYNRGMALATGSHICITGCDRVMPLYWLDAMIDAIERIPNTGVISVYSNDKPGEDKTIRYVGSPEIINGIYIQRALPCEARIHSREFLMEAGYFREDFGLYGYEDCEWADRANRVAKELGLINYILKDLDRATHLKYGDNGDYLAMKEKQAEDVRKLKLVQWCHDMNNPHYNPYSRIEENMLERMDKYEIQ